MTGPLGNSKFCFPRISMFPSTSSPETLRFSGNKIHCSPRDQSRNLPCPLRTRFPVADLGEGSGFPLILEKRRNHRKKKSRQGKQNWAPLTQGLGSPLVSVNRIIQQPSRYLNKSKRRYAFLIKRRISGYKGNEQNAIISFISKNESIKKCHFKTI